MKTAEEWQNELYASRYGQSKIVEIDELKQIQLDAWKQGMSDASNKLDRYVHGKWGTEETDIFVISIKRDILTARDNKKEI